MTTSELGNVSEACQMMGVSRDTIRGATISQSTRVVTRYLRRLPGFRVRVESVNNTGEREVIAEV